MSITTDTIETLAALARIGSTAEQRADWQAHLTQVLATVAPIREAATEGIEPLIHPLDGQQRLRPDCVTETNQREAFLALAPQTEQGLYLVPQVME